MADIQKYSEQTFESIKHINEYGQEFWYARELQTALEYTEWRNFKKIIDKAKDACATSGNPVGEHFVEVNKSSPMPNGGVREVEDFMLSRYACYLIVMNGDPRKEVIAVGQTYFAIKTRQQELVENYDELTENQKRIAIRHEMAEHNKSLAEAAQMAGVETSLDYATFQNYGYMGLYGGLRAADMAHHKGKDSRCNGQHHRFGQTAKHIENAAVPRLRSGANVRSDFAHLGVHVIEQAGEVARDAIDQNALYPFFDDLTNQAKIPPFPRPPM